MEERETFIPRPSYRPIIPLGLEALYAACRQIYPDQLNVLQVTTVVKYWLGGPDPLDYISMYNNPGNTDLGICPHWHYVTFGLSDLHGDGRVHGAPNTGNESGSGNSGFGFELTFRLKREADEASAPTWPAAVMQALAKYVFQSGNTLCAGDHVSWHCPLDNSESRVQHMLMCEDPQLGTVQTPFGSVTFVQIIGVFTEELQAAQDWNGPGITELMKTVVKGAGGPWLVTDMRRGESIFELEPSVQEAVEHGIEVEGSNLSGVSAKCNYRESALSICKEEIDEKNKDVQKCIETEQEKPSIPHLSVLESEQIKAALKKGLLGTKPILPPIHSKDQKFHVSADVDNVSSEGALESAELLGVQVLKSVSIELNFEAGTVLPLALRGRLKHGRHFTFKGTFNDIAITLLPPCVTGAFVDPEHPFAVRGTWLQLLFMEDFIDELLGDLTEVSNLTAASLPKTYSYPERNISITLVPEDY